MKKWSYVYVLAYTNGGYYVGRWNRNVLKRMLAHYEGRGGKRTIWRAISHVVEVCRCIDIPEAAFLEGFLTRQVTNKTYEERENCSYIELEELSKILNTGRTEI